MYRIQLDIPDDKAKDLEDLMAKTGISTKQDLFNHALTMFEWAVNEKLVGRYIATVDENSQTLKELRMPTLPLFSKGD